MKKTWDVPAISLVILESINSPPTPLVTVTPINTMVDSVNKYKQENKNQELYKFNLVYNYSPETNKF